MDSFVGIYTRVGAELRGVDYFNLPQTRWTFVGDGTLTTPPLALGSTVFIGGTSGKVYAVNGDNGNLLWTGDAGVPLPAHVAGDETQLRGLGGGEGWIVVPTGSSLRAWQVAP
jgi:hypothetical protein